MLCEDAEQAEAVTVFNAEYLSNHSPGCSPAEEWPDPLGSRSIETKCFAEDADATLEHVGPLQNLLLSKHGLLDVGNVHVAHHKNLKQRR